jgi:hypothetical protein
MPRHWREWLGTIRAEQVEGFDLFLISKTHSARPDILDHENNALRQHAWLFYVGLLLSSTFATAHLPVMLTGARQDGEIDVRQQQDFDSPAPRIFRPYPPVFADDTRLAAQLGTQLDAVPRALVPGGHRDIHTNGPGMRT